MKVSDLKKYIAEFVGTFVLVLFGCGSAVAANALISYQGLSIPLAFTTLTISFAFGLCIVAMAYSIGNVSGCHINPAVSIGCFIAGRMTARDLVGYIISQFLGGLAGAFMLSVILGTKAALGQNGYGSASALGTTAGIAVLIEIILTFVFVMVILAVTSKPEYSNVAGLVIGLTLVLIHILGIPFTGTSVNPARSFGPAVLVGGDALKQLPVFIIAPVIGAVLAALFYNFVLNTEEKPVPEAEAAPEETSEAEVAGEEQETAEPGAEEAAAEEEQETAEPEAEEAAAEEEQETAEPEAEEASAGTAGEAESETQEGSEETEESKKEDQGGYDPVEEMIMEPEPESVAEAEAGVIAEADAEADVE